MIDSIPAAVPPSVCDEDFFVLKPFCSGTGLMGLQLAYSRKSVRRRLVGKLKLDSPTFQELWCLKIIGIGIDNCELILWVLREYEEIQPIILSVGEDEEVSIGDVVNYIADAIDYHNIEYDHTKADGQYKKTASNAKLRKYLPDYKFTPMKQGIKETVDWFVKNYDSARK